MTALETREPPLLPRDLWHAVLSIALTPSVRTPGRSRNGQDRMGYLLFSGSAINFFCIAPFLFMFNIMPASHSHSVLFLGSCQLVRVYYQGLV
ncbi:uncharacterized protein BDW70DRAFT_87646 [Aspergillus foveolatus]|uniref:uncharacterized protein n=1 Tax=Aspergillus foveolatus TaxID=210207 RepID=UPI003CCCE026